MTTDTLTEAVLHEAEAVVCAEWMRLQHHSASRDDTLTDHAPKCPPPGPAPQRGLAGTGCRATEVMPSAMSTSRQ